MPKRRTTLVRTSDQRWGQLFLLLRAFERAVEVSSRLDAYLPQFDAHGDELPVGPHKYEQFKRFEFRLRRIEQRIDLEFDRLTSDRLRVDLTRKLAAA